MVAGLHTGFTPFAPRAHFFSQKVMHLIFLMVMVLTVNTLTRSDRFRIPLHVHDIYSLGFTIKRVGCSDMQE